MIWYEEEVKGLEKQLVDGKIPVGSNLFFGSSSFRLWETLKEDMSDYEVANLAFGGSTLEACVYFFERLIIPAKPRSLILYAGDNDIGDGKGVDKICSYLGAFLAKLDTHFPDIPFAYLSVKPSLVREYLDWQIREVNRYAKERLEVRENSKFIDIYPRMLNSRGRPNPDLFSKDGLHLSPDGYAIWREVLLQNAEGVLI